jgi:hypothetical protein
VNLILASAWKVGTDKLKSSPLKEPQIYHSVTGANPVTWKGFFDLSVENAKKYPLGEFKPNYRYRFFYVIFQRRRRLLVSATEISTNALRQQHRFSWERSHSK